MTPWNTLVLVAAVIAMLVFTAWTLRLRAADDPAWKLVGAAALLSFVTGGLELGHPMIWSVLAFLVLLLAGYWIWSFGRGRSRKAS